MNIRRIRVLHDAGSRYAEIARECGGDPRTVKKYLQLLMLTSPRRQRTPDRPASRR